MTSLGRILDTRGLEVALHDGGLPLRAPEVRSDGGDQFGRLAGPAPAQGVALDVVVQEFIRVEVRAVAREEEEPKAVGRSATQRATAFATWTGCRSTMRNTGRRTWRSRRRRNRRNTGVVKRLRNTMKASRPRLVIVESTLQRKRCPVPGITGVCPFRP